MGLARTCPSTRIMAIGIGIACCRLKEVTVAGDRVIRRPQFTSAVAHGDGLQELTGMLNVSTRHWHPLSAASCAAQWPADAYSSPARVLLSLVQICASMVPSSSLLSASSHPSTSSTPVWSSSAVLASSDQSTPEPPWFLWLLDRLVAVRWNRMWPTASPGRARPPRVPAHSVATTSPQLGEAEELAHHEAVLLLFDHLSGVEEAEWRRSCHQSLLAQHPHLTAKHLCWLANALYLDSPEDVIWSLLLWEMGAGLGERNSLFSLASFLRRGHPSLVVACDPLAAALYFRAARQLHPDAMYNLALMYDQNRLSTLSARSWAFHWFQRAHDLGVSEATTDLAIYYRSGMGPGRQDVSKCLALLEQAAGHDDPRALLLLADLYTSRQHASATGGFHPRRAFECWSRVVTLLAHSKDASRDTARDWLSQALSNLGNLCFLGIGLTEDGRDWQRPDYELATEYWEWAVRHYEHNLMAWLHLGNMYYDGLVDSGSPQFQTALDMYERAVKSGMELGLAPVSEPENVPLVPIDPQATQAEILFRVAAAMASVCRRKLARSVEDPDGVRPKVSSISSLWSSLTNNNGKMAKKKADWAGSLFGTEELPDHEETFLQGLRKRNFAEEARVVALQSRWKFVENMSAS